MINKVRSKIRAQIVNGKTVKLGLALIQAIIVFFLPLRIIRGGLWGVHEISTRERFNAFFVMEEQWKEETIPWTVNIFGDYNISLKIELVEIIWFIGVSSLIINELLRKKSILLSIISIQGQILFIGYSIIALTSFPLKELIHADVARRSYYEFTFTAYYWMVVLIGILIILAELNELKSQKINETWFPRVFLISNLYGVILNLAFNEQYDDEIVQFLHAKKIFFEINIYNINSLIIQALMICTFAICLYIFSEREIIQDKVEYYIIYSLYALVGWWVVFKTAKILISNISLREQVIELQSISFFIIILLIWFSPIIIYDVKKILKKHSKEKYAKEE